MCNLTFLELFPIMRRGDVPAKMFLERLSFDMKLFKPELPVYETSKKRQRFADNDPLYNGDSVDSFAAGKSNGREKF